MCLSTANQNVWPSQDHGLLSLFPPFTPSFEGHSSQAPCLHPSLPSFVFMQLRATQFASPLFCSHSNSGGWGTLPPQKDEKVMTTHAQDVSNTEVLPSETAPAANPSGDASRCQHRYDNGTRCRHRASDSQLGLCLRHVRLKLAGLSSAPDDSADLSPQLLSGIKFSCADDLREFLTRLLIQMAKGRVSPRRASVLAYISTQLLHTHVAAEKELDKDSDSNFFFNFGTSGDATETSGDTSLHGATSSVTVNPALESNHD